MNTTVYRGTTVPVYFPAAKDVRGDIVDLTGATVRCAAQTDGGPEVVATTWEISNPPGGVAKAEFTAAQSSAFTSNAVYSYDGIATLPDGRVVPLGYGSFVAKDLISTPG